MKLDFLSWRAILMIGAYGGCRPDPAILARLSTIERQEKSPIPSVGWYGYLWPDIDHVDAEFATCLKDALDRAIERLAHPAFGLNDEILQYEGESLTRVALRDFDLKTAERVRDFCREGAFDVKIGYFLDTVTLSRS
jgi:hypothetical protein